VWPALAALLLVAVLAVGGWIALRPPLAQPYRLTASAADLAGEAPDRAAAARIAAAYAKAAGHESHGLRIARGAPGGWADAAAEVLALTATLDDWRLALNGAEAALSGRAPDARSAAMVETRFRDWASRRGFEPRLQIEVVSPPLDPRAVSALLQRHANCGPLSEGETEGTITGT
ncbi:serine/threonine protein kinase, partial [Rhodovulum sulfidophilum]|nr:serine/threonine protein kinase [Rhodovulum sulfidophilum]